ncbi:MAG: UPF0149 family protein [Geminicoccaceae bacterium]
MTPPRIELTDFDPEILDAFLTSDRVPESCMRLSELDGFLTAIAIGPELILPSEWLPVIWGEGEPVFESDEELQSVVGAIFGRYEEILRTIQDEPEAYAPLFWETLDGQLLAADWAAGFMAGVGLRTDAWRSLLQTDEGCELVAPIIAFLDDEDGNPVAELEPDELAAVREAAVELIGPSVHLIHRFWQARRRMPRRVAKTGRNEPCPCGSGRKYKRCCGAT